MLKRLLAWLDKLFGFKEPPPLPPEPSSKLALIWPVKNGCITCGADTFRVWSRREEGCVIPMRLDCSECATEYDLSR